MLNGDQMISSELLDEPFAAEVADPLFSAPPANIVDLTVKGGILRADMFRIARCRVLRWNVTRARLAVADWRAANQSPERSLIPFRTIGVLLLPTNPEFSLKLRGKAKSALRRALASSDRISVSR
jgi:hypothetical protein